jgi:uncharacterized membrane protein
LARKAGGVKVSSANVNDPEERKPRFFSRFKATVQRRMFDGVVVLIPLLVTILVLAFLIEKADLYIRRLTFIEGQTLLGFPVDFPGIGVIVFLIIFFLVGLIVATAWGRKIIEVKSTILRNTPVVGSIYGVTEQLTEVLSSKYNFSRVVFLEWPREGMLALGFVTGRAYNVDTRISLAVVYVPTVPNPTSGNMAFVNEDDVFETDISVEMAMRLVFTGGIVMPEYVSLARLPRETVDEDEDNEWPTDNFGGRFHLEAAILANRDDPPS